jgi:F-type H+-transporting ATPase subunit gamma
MPGIKELKTRIKSISGTRKVTRAMQMVSAAKMRKSQDATMRSRSYASLAWELIGNLTRVADTTISSESDESRNLLSSGNQGLTDPSTSVGMEQLMTTFPKASKIAVLILTTNRGMVGSLNANLLNLVQKTINQVTSPNPFFEKGGNGPILPLAEGELEGVKDVDFITYGRKGRDVMVRSHKEVLADFEKFDRTISTQDIFPISELITKLYQSGKYQKVLIFYNHFVSTLVQKPTMKQLLPFANPSLQPTSYNLQATGYLFEPDPQEVLKHLLPRIIESQIYQTILESEASEQSARMVMMKNATEAAGDLISDLTLTYNKLRQNKITTELAEITAGKIALE